MHRVFTNSDLSETMTTSSQYCFDVYVPGYNCKPSHTFIVNLMFQSFYPSAIRPEGYCRHHYVRLSMGWVGTPDHFSESIHWSFFKFCP